MSTVSDKFDLLTLSDVAQLLHCSKAHVGKVVDGRIPGCAATRAYAWDAENWCAGNLLPDGWKETKAIKLCHRW